MVSSNLMSNRTVFFVFLFFLTIEIQLISFLSQSFTDIVRQSCKHVKVT